MVTFCPWRKENLLVFVHRISHDAIGDVPGRLPLFRDVIAYMKSTTGHFNHLRSPLTSGARDLAEAGGRSNSKLRNQRREKVAGYVGP